MEGYGVDIVGGGDVDKEGESLCCTLDPSVDAVGDTVILAYCDDVLKDNSPNRTNSEGKSRGVHCGSEDDEAEEGEGEEEEEEEQTLACFDRVYASGGGDGKRANIRQRELTNRRALGREWMRGKEDE